MPASASRSPPGSQRRRALVLSIVLAVTGRRGSLFLILCGAALIFVGLEVAVIRI